MSAAAPVRIGVLGCAAIARRRMLPAFDSSPAVELVAVASRDPDKADANARAHGCRAVHGYEALLADDEVDAVYLPLPAALHAEWIEAALLAGKHVLAEKPMTTSRAETARLVSLAARRRLVLMENVMFVHHSQHGVVRSLVADGAIGELRSFRAEFTIPHQPEGDIRYQPALAGGALRDTGVYPLRAALHMLGADLRIAGAVLTDPHGYGVDTAGAVLLTTPSGVVVHLAFGMDHGYRNTYEICGSDGRIVVDRAFTPPADLRPRLRVEHRSAEREVELPGDDQVTNTVAAFADAVRRGGTPAEVSEVYLVQAALIDGVLARCG